MKNTLKKWWEAEDEYNFHKKLSGNPEEAVSFDDYKKTGRWGGYKEFKPQILDYKYVEQMANALSGKYEVGVKVGNSFTVDLYNKTLTYDPLVLIQGTKAELISNLLYLLGKIKHNSDPSVLEKKGILYSKYEFNGTKDILNVLERFRIEKIVHKDFSNDYGEQTAEDIFIDTKEVEEELADYFFKLGDKVRKLESDIFEQEHEDLLDLDEDSIKLKEETLQKLRNEENIYDYIGNLILSYYGHPLQEGITEEMKSYLKSTQKLLPRTNSSTSTQETHDILEKDFLSVLEPLFHKFDDSLKGGNPTINKAFPENNHQKHKIGRQVALKLLSSMNSDFNQVDKSDFVNKINKNSGTGRVLPQEWLTGEYKPLKDSVQSQITELKRKITFLKRTEESSAFEPQKTRGRVNLKGLYRQKAGERRLFKQKVEKEQTITSFTFSIILDTSGSMYIEPILHSLRGVIILAEVFKSVDIPFEIIGFGDSAKVFKSYNDPYTDKQKKQIAGTITKAGTSSNLFTAINKSEIRKQPQNNKIMIILSDGYVGEYQEEGTYYDRTPYPVFFTDWKKKHNVKPIGIGVQCGDEIKNVCLGIGKGIENPAELPEAFVDIMKNEVFKKGR